MSILVSSMSILSLKSSIIFNGNFMEDLKDDRKDGVKYNIKVNLMGNFNEDIKLPKYQSAMSNIEVRTNCRKKH